MCRPIVSGDNKASKGAEQCVGRVNGRRASGGELARPRVDQWGKFSADLRRGTRGRREEQLGMGRREGRDRGVITGRGYVGALVNVRNIPPRPVSKQEILEHPFISFRCHSPSNTCPLDSIFTSFHVSSIFNITSTINELALWISR